LEKEIQEGLVAVNETDIKSVVTIKGDRLFAPGSATISENYLALINRIADGINAVPGHVQITGHTDNIPIRSVRFPSNWHLSQSRAESVLELIANKVPKGRLSAEGRAESEPIVPNDTPENRSRNRRVEITLFAAQKP
jgi:type VI secretion system protein ImpK